MKRALLITIALGAIITIGMLSFIGIRQSVLACEEFVATSTTIPQASTTTSIDEEGTTHTQPIMSEEEAFELCLYGADNEDASAPLAVDYGEMGYENGRLPLNELQVVSSHGNYDCMVARAEGAADAWLDLVAAARADNVDIEGGWCYRTYQEQLAAYNSRRCYLPGNCDGNPFPPTARPGTSNHGWGLAVDVWNRFNTTLSCSDPEFVWMQIHAPDFGWQHPAWARCGRSTAEAWHWEYVGRPIEPVDSE